MKWIIYFTQLCLLPSLFLSVLLSKPTTVNAMFNVQEEHLHYLDITSGTGTTSADILAPHNTPNGVSVSSLMWNTAPAGAGGDISLQCKPTATSTALDSFHTNNNTSGFFDTAFFCPTHLFLTCSKTCWVGLNTWAGDYRTQQGTSLIKTSLATSSYQYPNMATSSSDIGIISYRATTTNVSATTSVIESSYTSPFLLFGFISIVVIITLLVISIFLTNRKRNK